jgi:hypothetical protein
MVSGLARGLNSPTNMAECVNGVDWLGGWLRTYFAEVLARESACLAGVADGAMLASWRRGVVEELMTPQSPYVLAFATDR